MSKFTWFFERTNDQLVSINIDIKLKLFILLRNSHLNFDATFKESYIIIIRKRGFIYGVINSYRNSQFLFYIYKSE